MKAPATKPPALVESEMGMRERIVAATIAAMAETGPQPTNIARIAEIAQVSRASIYNYFASREALITAAETALEDAFYQHLQAQMDKFTRFDDQIVACIASSRKNFTAGGYSPWFGRLDETSEAIAFVDVSVVHYQTLMDFLLPYVAAAQRAGHVRTSLDPYSAAEWVARVVYIFGLRPAGDPEAEPIEIMHWVKEFLMPGIGHARR